MKLDIVMHCFGLPFNGDTVKLKSLGGSESAAYYMAKEFAIKGHNVILFTNTNEPGMFDGVNYENAGEYSEQFPLGDKFHKYAEQIPHDVLIVQRHPAAFTRLYASKVNILWLHDLALHRTRPQFAQQMWNIQGVFTVSEYHKKQVCDVYGLNPNIVMPITNGIDSILYQDHLTTSLASLASIDVCANESRVNLIYSSRPERGLENLVKPGGIMEWLIKDNHSAHLYVCGYENTTPQMEQYYNYLWQRCEELPNVTNLGALTKQQLADVQRQCDAWVYPTQFEEVSCITAMECMAAGIRIIASEHAAIPETVGNYTNAKLIPLLKDNVVDLNEFVQAVKALPNTEKTSNRYITWKSAAELALDHIHNIYKKNSENKGTIARQLLDNSDIHHLKTMLEYADIESELTSNEILFSCGSEFTDCYKFYLEDNFKQHYEDYYQYELDRGQNYGPEDLSGNSRFQVVQSMLQEYVQKFSDTKIIMDIGCAHGHYTINLAKSFPQINFIGIDLAESNIAKAKAWAEQENLTNVEFHCLDIDEVVKTDYNENNVLYEQCADVILTCEVLEHVADPGKFLFDIKALFGKRDTLYLSTTPYGPWEKQGYKEHWPWRAHLWHLDKDEIKTLFGDTDNFRIATVPAGRSKDGDLLGSYVYTYSLWGNTPDFLNLSYSDKVEKLMPRQTVSLCMIVRNGESTLKACLDSAADYVDEIVIAIDSTTNDNTQEVITNFKREPKNPPVVVIHIPSPLKIGFDAARNQSIIHANGDWIMWLDADETLQHGHNLRKYLTSNMFDGYAIAQHHFAVEPLGVLKTDLPCRIFRNGLGVKFFGVVHEHPEKALNEGPGYIQVLSDVAIVHNGYTTEEIRRGRFARNIDLMRRDRERYPERHLGKFLWIRDLSQLVQYELERNGGQVMPHHIEMAKEGIALWEDLLDCGQVRMLLDGMGYYSMLNKVLGDGFEFSFAVKASKLNGGADLAKAQPVAGLFHSREHIDKLMSKLIDAETEHYESRYF